MNSTIDGATMLFIMIGILFLSVLLRNVVIWKRKADKYDKYQKFLKEGYVPSLSEMLEDATFSRLPSATKRSLRLIRFFSRGYINSLTKFRESIPKLSRYYTARAVIK